MERALLSVPVSSQPCRQLPQPRGPSRIDSALNTLLALAEVDTLFTHKVSHVVPLTGMHADFPMLQCEFCEFVAPRHREHCEGDLGLIYPWRIPTI